jgi:hypothetical protein
MSTNAGKWFYSEPEENPYLITERLNATFWTARIVELYWRCVRAEKPVEAIGYSPNGQYRLTWMPGEWLALQGPVETSLDPLVEAISNRVLAFPPSLAFGNHDGHQIIEWHRDGGAKRWSEIQGRAEYVHPRRL